MKILITGFAGFIGFHLTTRLVKEGHQVYGIDNMSQVNSYRRWRLLPAIVNKVQEFVQCDLIIHLAAKPGVQLSMTHPEQYLDNMNYFVRVLQYAKRHNIKLLYASSSSADDPGSFYGLTKYVNEQTARLLYPNNSVGMRFFTVYGPWGREDMSYYKFTKAILENRPIELWGDYSRDFTYIDDLVDGILQCMQFSNGIWELGSDNPQPVQHLIYCLEKNLGKKAIVEVKPTTDRPYTCAVNTILQQKHSLEDGIEKFVTWYKENMI